MLDLSLHQAWPCLMLCFSLKVASGFRIKLSTVGTVESIVSTFLQNEVDSEFVSEKSLIFFFLWIWHSHHGVWRLSRSKQYLLLCLVLLPEICHVALSQISWRQRRRQGMKQKLFTDARLNFGAVTFIHGRNVTFSYTHWRTFRTTAVVCQWWKPEFVVGCESVNIGHDQAWELFPAGAGMFSAQKPDNFLVLCQLMLALHVAKYLNSTFGLGFCFPQNFTDLSPGSCVLIVIHLFFFSLRHRCAYCYATRTGLQPCRG